MKHIAKIQKEFLKVALDDLMLNKGSLVKLQGVPFELKDNTAVAGKQENLDLVATNKKPSFFQGTKYRDPTDVELLEIHESGPTGEDLMKGFGYAMIGRGMLNNDNKAMIISAIERLCKLQSSNKGYWAALEQAKSMSR